MSNLRTYLKKLDTALPGQLIKVKEPVDWKYGITARATQAEKTPGNPALLLENIKGYKTPVLINLFGTIDRIHLALQDAKVGQGRLAFYSDWNRLFNNMVPPTHVKTGPVKEVINKGSKVNLESLPIPWFYPEDAGRYITAGLTAARNPTNPEEVNLTYIRMQLQGPDRFGVSLHSRGHMWQYYQQAKANDQPLEVAVILGAHPALGLAAAAKITDEYSKVGALTGEPVELVDCETVDVPVPAQAEIILEGVMPHEEMDEGPFTEYTGYISGRSTRNLLQITAITSRNNPIFHAIFPNNSAEHLLLSGLPKQARITQALTQYTHMPALKDINWPTQGTHFITLLSLNPAATATPGLPKQVALLLLGLDHYVKIAAILPATDDVSDPSQALTAIARRCDLKHGSGLEVLGGVYSHLLDPSSPRGGLSGKMILDATGPEIAETGAPDTTAKLRGVKGVAQPVPGVAQLLAVTATDTLQPRTLLEAKPLKPARLIIIVDPDIDPHDPGQLLWAIATRSQPDTDTTAQDGRLVIDARKGQDWTAKRATLPEA
ncbi:MAG: UbiD family decarboxylase [Candidatus Bathyarchaeota archaeon]